MTNLTQQQAMATQLQVAALQAEIMLAKRLYEQGFVDDHTAYHWTCNLTEQIIIAQRH